MSMKYIHLKLAVIVIAVILASGCLHSQLIDTSGASKVTFSCENSKSGIEKRGYVLLMGLADHNKEGWVLEKSYMEQDPKAEFVVIYDQDEKLHLPQITEKFLADMHELLKAKPVDELVIFGASAGGITASYSISKLNFSGRVAVHTLSSPLKGYGFSGFKEQFLGDRSGYLRDIAIGLKPFPKPNANVKVYHHKTLRDTILIEHYCNGFTFLCNERSIQNNNIQGSKEFFYPNYDHNPLMKVVIPQVLKCYNEDLVVLNPEVVGGLGEICTGETECNLFCHSNMGICTEYCNSNPSNTICQKLIARSRSGAQNQTSEAGQAPVASETQQAQLDVPPVLKNLGVEIEHWNRQTNRAGDVLFGQSFITNGEPAVQNDRPFVEFGYKPEGRQENIEYWFYTPLGTKLRAPVDGVVSISFFNHTNDWGINIASRQGSSWIVSFEHVVNLAVKEGDVVKAGDVVAEAAPRSGFNGQAAMTELAVWKAGTGIIKYCPFSFLDESLKPLYEQKLNQLATDWELFAGKEVYQQQNWAAPGCLVNQIIERDNTGPVVQQSNVSNLPNNSAAPVDALPVLKNLGVEFGAWDKNTNRSGAFIFKENEQKLFMEFGAVVNDASGGTKMLPTFEYRTEPDADVYAIADGTITKVEYQEYFNDYEIHVIPSSAPNWRIYQDHVKNPRVSAYQEVKAGDVLGKVGNADNGLVGRTEISVGRGTGSGPVGYCPFNYFDTALASEYRKKVSQHIRDWEEFKGNSSIYDEENHIAPGCRFNAMIEDLSTGQSTPYYGS